MDRDPIVREAEQYLAFHDPIRFFHYHAWTYDPRPGILALYGLKYQMLPFLLFDFQQDELLKLVDHINSGRDILVEKSRDMGVSWLVITIFVWFWAQPVSGNDFLIGSRKIELVDRIGAQDTIFEKARYNIKNLHPALKPAGFEPRKHDNYCFIVNPESGNYLKGESNNANFGTGGRYKAIMMDEFSKWEETDSQAWTSTSDATPCRIPVSTPWGMGRKFAQIRFEGAIDVSTLHWSQHPLKAAGMYEDDKGKKKSPWYDNEVERRRDDPETSVGQELDLNYLTSGHPYFDNEIIQARYKKLCEEPELWNRYEFERVGDSITLIPHEHGRIVIRKMPYPNKEYSNYRYGIAADVAEGLDKHDYDYAVAFDRVKGEDMAWFHGHVDTDIFALILFHLYVLYDNAWVAPENNNHGLAVIQKLKSLDVPMMHEQEFSEIVNLDNVRLGWNTNIKSRPVMCSDLREAVRDGVDGIYDPQFFLEAQTFIQNKNGKPEAAQGNYDDRVMAQAIKFQLHKWLPAPVKTVVLRPDYGYSDHGRLNRETAKKRASNPRLV